MSTVVKSIHTFVNYILKTIHVILCMSSVLYRVNGHDVAAGLLVKTAGPKLVNISDAKGRWVLLCIRIPMYYDWLYISNLISYIR